MPIPRPPLLYTFKRAPLIGGLAKWLDVRYLDLRYRWRDRYGVNAESRGVFASEPASLSDCQRRVVGDLAATGIAVTTFGDLFGGDPESWAAVNGHAQQFLASPDVQERLARNRAARTDSKNYLVAPHSLDRCAVPASDPWVQLALSPQLLTTVNACLGLCSRLHMANLWHTAGDSAARPRLQSQRWHRDPEDADIIKVFIYFSDVGVESGALEYVVGSAPGGRLGHLWPFTTRNRYGYPPQDEFDRLVPASARVTCAGPPGTIVFCRTSGFHRGGYVVAGDRTVASLAYVPPACLWPPLIEVSGELTGRTSAAARYAVRRDGNCISGVSTAAGPVAL